MARATWYRLDNIGKFYSSQAGSSAQTVFRFSATLTDAIDADTLQRAVERTVSIFPSFNVCLRSGMFWHYLEQSDTPPEVQPENLPICFGLHVSTKSVLFRVSYYKNRINLEVSHIISDGRGTNNFFKALLYAYLEERYDIQDIVIEYDGSDNQKSEDSFDKYYERGKASSLRPSKRKALSSKKARVFRLAGWRDLADPTYLEFHLPLDEVKTLAREFEVSVTSLMLAVFIYAISKEIPERHRKREIRIGIPVDLRDIFGSTTTKNFFGLAFVSYVPDTERPVAELAVQMQEELAYATTPEQIKPRMNRMIKLEKNPFLRFSPLFMKDLALGIADSMASRDRTTTVSNLGQIKLDDQIAPYVKEINILTSTSGLNMVLCSCGNDMSVCISSVYANLDIVKHFCRYFSEQGIYGHVNYNKTNEEAEADWRETQIETSVRRLSGQAPAAAVESDGCGEVEANDGASPNEVPNDRRSSEGHPKEEGR